RPASTTDSCRPIEALQAGGESNRLPLRNHRSRCPGCTSGGRGLAPTAPAFPPRVGLQCPRRFGRPPGYEIPAACFRRAASDGALPILLKNGAAILLGSLIRSGGRFAANRPPDQGISRAIATASRNNLRAAFRVSERMEDSEHR